MNDKLAFHPQAAKALDADGERLVASFQVSPLERHHEDKFPSRKYVGPTITDKDMVGEPLLAWSDWKGRTTGRYFVKDRQEIALRAEGYNCLRRLTQKILRTRPFSKGVGEDFVETEAFIWARAKYRQETKESLTDHIQRRVQEEWQTHQVVVPLSAIEIERPFRLGNVLVSTITPSFFDNAYKAATTMRPQEEHDHIRKYIEREKKKFVGSAAVEISLEGEKAYVENEAFAVANEIAAIFRFSPLPLFHQHCRFPVFRRVGSICREEQYLSG